MNEGDYNFTPEHMDHVKCHMCGATGLVFIATEMCPACGYVGGLADVTPGEPEISLEDADKANIQIIEGDYKEV